MYNQDRMKFKEEDQNANLYSYGIGLNYGLSNIIYSGYEVFLTHFQIDDDLYKKLGNNTLSEMGTSNKGVRVGSAYRLGIQVPIKSFSIGYEYNLVSVVRNYHFGYRFVSGFIQTVPIVVVESLLKNAMKKNLERKLRRWTNGRKKFDLKKEKRKLIVKYVVLNIAMTGANYGFYHLNYERPDWPFNRSKPLYYHKHNITFSFPLKIMDFEK